MKYESITITVNRNICDEVCTMLYELPIQGVEVIDQFIDEDEQELMFVDAFEIENIKKEKTPIRFYISEEENLKEIMARVDKMMEVLGSRVDLGEWTIESEARDENEWANNWKQYAEPFSINDKILIHPTWTDMESYPQYADLPIKIDMDPGMAFGSGTHETTSLCIQSLDDYIKDGDHVIDVGCGSGILGIVAAKLGAKSCSLVDLDLAAVQVAKENVAINGVENKISVFHGDLLENIEENAEIVVANIFAEVIMAVAPEVFKRLKKSGHFIASGIIREKEVLVSEHLASLGYKVVEVKRQGGWVAIISTR